MVKHLRPCIHLPIFTGGCFRRSWCQERSGHGGGPLLRVGRFAELRSRRPRNPPNTHHASGKTITTLLASNSSCSFFFYFFPFSSLLLQSGPSMSFLIPFLLFSGLPTGRARRLAGSRRLRRVLRGHVYQALQLFPGSPRADAGPHGQVSRSAQPPGAGRHLQERSGPPQRPVLRRKKKACAVFHRCCCSP